MPREATVSLRSPLPPISREFQTLVGLKDGLYLERLFALFDSNNDGSIAFKEFLQCISFLSSKMPKEERVKCECLSTP